MLAKIDARTGRLQHVYRLAKAVGEGVIGHIEVLPALGHDYAVFVAPPAPHGHSARLVLTRIK